MHACALCDQQRKKKKWKRKERKSVWSPLLCFFFFNFRFIRPFISRVSNFCSRTKWNFARFFFSRKWENFIVPSKWIQYKYNRQYVLYLITRNLSNTTLFFDPLRFCLSRFLLYFIILWWWKMRLNIFN